MWAPKRPRSTLAPSDSRAVQKESYRGSETGPGAAALQDGRRPLRVSAYRVNWLIARIGACSSAQERSSCRMRRVQIFAASAAAFSGGVVVGDAEEDHQSRRVDRADHLALDGDRCLADSLYDCSHDAHPAVREIVR